MHTKRVHTATQNLQRMAQTSCFYCMHDSVLSLVRYICITYSLPFFVQVLQNIVNGNGNAYKRNNYLANKREIMLFYCCMFCVVYITYLPTYRKSYKYIVVSPIRLNVYLYLPRKVWRTREEEKGYTKYRF